MAAIELNKIEVGDELETTELNLIADLKLDAFNANPDIEDIDELKTVLKTAKINVITSAKDAATETKEEKTLSEIATAFSTYVEKKPEGWWLQLIEANKADAPVWIQYIIENPKNNDLAYFIQKLSALIEYQTARAYTADELNAVEVSVDKTFGNQTKRALIGLKAWIENEWDYKNVAEGQTYTGKYLNKSYVEWIVSTGKTDEEKNTVLAKYNLQYVNEQIQPKDGYEFVDPYSNNLAVVQSVKKDVNNQLKNQSDNQSDNIENYQSEKVVYDNFNEEYLTWLESILNNNKKDIVDFLRSIDKKYLWDYAEFASLINEKNVRFVIKWQELSVNIGLFSPFMKSIKIKTSAAIDANMNYNKERFTKALENQLIKEYVQLQYKNIPIQTKAKVYTIANSNNVKAQTFIKENDFNNLNILNYAALDKNNNVIFSLPDTSNGKPIKHLKELKSIKIEVKQVVKGNDVDLTKLKTLLDAEISKIIWIEISELSSIKEKKKN